MYILLTNDNTVAEIIPDIDPVFPGVPIGERYAPNFVEQLIHVPDETEVQQNWDYDPETGVFSEPKPIDPAVFEKMQAEMLAAMNPPEMEVTV